MIPLRTAVIEHTTATGVHHDWLIEDPTLPNPRHPEARLWTARVTPAPSQWAKLGRFDLEVLPPHRRAYLTYQGEVSGNRGRVRRVAEGWCVAELWSEGRLFLEISSGSAITRAELIRITDSRWIASCRLLKSSAPRL